MIKYQLIKSQRRKTVGLQVKKGQVIVRAPSYLSDEQIDELIKTKSAWLQLKVLEQANAPLAKTCFTQGSHIWVNGESKPLNIVFHSVAQVLNLTNEIRVVIATRHHLLRFDENKLALRVKKQLEAWFLLKANAYISQRLIDLSQLTKLTAKSFTIRQYQARWGSCNNKGELRFNYLLMMAPSWVIDYVIVHELCHLKHLNHSKDFWQLVASNYPRYKEAKTWLKYHQSHLLWKLT